MKLALGTMTLIMVLTSQISVASAESFKFKNCSELNKVYPGGVAKPGAVNRGGITRLSPKFDLKLYLANAKSDRDKDGIACEQ
jgi:hypothetical protein